MNKLGLVLGVAAVAAIAGCKDPNYGKHKKNVQNEAQPVATESTDVAVPEATPVKDIEIVPVTTGCTCPPGSVHTEPCACGAADCKCVVKPLKPVVTAPETPAAAETTTYIVQRGDTLSLISKRYNIKMDAIKRANPKMQGDTVRVGQKLQLPGKVEVGEQVKPTVAPVRPVKEYKPYVGATKDYTIQNGDSLGLIAKKNGISVRQLKELNGLKSDVIMIGKKLKVPAEKGAAVAAAPAVTAAKSDVPNATAPVAAATAPAEAAPKATPAAETAAPKADAAAGDAAAAPQPLAGEKEVAQAAKAVEEGPTHVVREGEDMTGLSILYSLSPAEIRSFNNLGENDELKPGQVIKLPAETQL